MSQCESCGHVFDYPYLLKRHQKNKRACSMINNEENIEISENTCEYCFHEYTTQSNLKRHQIKCKARKISKDSAYRKKYIRAKEELDRMREINEKQNELMQKVLEQQAEILKRVGDGPVQNGQISGNQNTQNFTTNNINVKIVPFDDCDMDKFVRGMRNLKGAKGSQHRKTLKSIGGLIRQNKPMEVIQEVVNHIHNNELYPEAQNLFLASDGEYKGLYVAYKGEKGWSIADIDDVNGVVKDELLEIMRQIEWDAKHKKSRKCIDTFHGKYLEEDMHDTVEKSVKGFKKSKIHPTKIYYVKVSF